MGLRIRKSFNFGPVRINLSKSGIGYSLGIGGVRWTVLPNGRVRTTTTIPGTGISWVEEGQGHRSKTVKIPHAEIEKRNQKICLDAPKPDMELSYNNTSNQKFVSTTNEEILDRMRFCKRNRLILIGAIILSLPLFWIHPLFIFLTIFLISIFQLKKNSFSIRLEYKLDPEMNNFFKNILSFWETIKPSEEKFVIDKAYTVNEEKYYAGAGYLMQTKKMEIKEKLPAYISANVKCCCVQYGQKKIYFLPDIVLVDTGFSIFSVSFGDFQFYFLSGPHGCIGRVPNDTKIIGKTWRYVNKKGGPDKRFANNYSVPIALYGTICIKCLNNFSIIIQHSNAISNNEAEKIYKELKTKIKELTAFKGHRYALNEFPTEWLPFGKVDDIICKNCGHRNNGNNNYCVKCGNFLNRKKEVWENT